jgi:hypothetical protein
MIFLHEKVDDAVKFIMNARSMRKSYIETIQGLEVYVQNKI